SDIGAAFIVGWVAVTLLLLGWVPSLLAGPGLLQEEPSHFEVVPGVRRQLGIRALLPQTFLIMADGLAQPQRARTAMLQNAVAQVVEPPGETRTGRVLLAAQIMELRFAVMAKLVQGRGLIECHQTRIDGALLGVAVQVDCQAIVAAGKGGVSLANQLIGVKAWRRRQRCQGEDGQPALQSRIACGLHAGFPFWAGSRPPF